MTETVSAFERATVYRMTVEAARVWLISEFLARGKLPEELVLFVYANGPDASLDWGNSPGPDDGMKPMRGRRVRVTFQVEEH